MPPPFFDAVAALLKDRPIGRFSEEPPGEAAPRDASVLVPLLLKDGHPHVLLTRRTEHLAHHPGQIAFPGGSRDARDEDASATALREAHEEIGLDPAQVSVLGQLDTLFTITRFVVSPFVAAIPYPYDFRANAHEVAEILILPLAGFLAPGAERLETREAFGQLHRIYFYEVEGTVVWGATARMLHQLLELVRPLLARDRTNP